MSDSIKDALYLRVGGAVGVPPANVKALSLDASGNTQILDSTGTASSACVPPDPIAYITSLFQTKTGLSPLAFSTFGNHFMATQFPVTGGAGSGSQGAQVGGTGATAAYNGAFSGGVIKLTGPSSGAGFADLQNGAGGFNSISNPRTKRWMMAYRAAIGKAPSAASTINLGITDGTNYVGLGYTGAASVWAYQRGALPAIATTVNTAKAIDSSDSVFLWMYTYNNGTNIVVNPDLVGGAVETVGEAASAISATAARPYVWNEGTGAADIIELDALVLCVES